MKSLWLRSTNNGNWHMRDRMKGFVWHCFLAEIENRPNNSCNLRIDYISAIHNMDLINIYKH